MKKNLLTDDYNMLKYICTDVARRSFKYKDSNNVLQNDPKCIKLFDHIYSRLKRNIIGIYVGKNIYSEDYGDYSGQDKLDEQFRRAVLRENAAEFSDDKKFKPALITAIADITIPETPQKSIRL